MQIEGQMRNHGSAVLLKVKGLRQIKSASWSMLLDNFRLYSSRVVAMVVIRESFMVALFSVVL